MHTYVKRGQELVFCHDCTLKGDPVSFTIPKNTKAVVQYDVIGVDSTKASGLYLDVHVVVQLESISLSFSCPYHYFISFPFPSREVK
jgi:hypothetical protein